eukprot:3349341-Amphidinium_carterae.1
MSALPSLAVIGKNTAKCNGKQRPRGGQSHNTHVNKLTKQNAPGVGTLLLQQLRYEVVRLVSQKSKGKGQMATTLLKTSHASRNARGMQTCFVLPV